MITIYKLQGSYFAFRDELNYTWLNKEIEFEYSSLPRNTKVQLPCKPESFAKRSISYREIGATRNGVKIDLDEYKRILGNFIAEKDEYGDFTDLDTKHAYEKHIHGVNIETEAVVNWTELEFKIIDLEKVKSLTPYTTPMRLASPGNSKTMSLFEYSPDIFEMTKEIGEKYGFTFSGFRSVLFSSASDDYTWIIDKDNVKDMQFIKVGSVYAKYEILKNLKKGAVGTDKECQQVHEQNLAIIERFWQHEALKRSEVKPSKDTVKAINNHLESLIHALDRIEPKSKSVWEHNSAVKNAREIQDILINLMKK